MKFNTMLDVAFTVNHDFDDPYKLIQTDEGIALVMAALKQRLDFLASNKSECAEAFGVCDTYSWEYQHIP